VQSLLYIVGMDYSKSVEIYEIFQLFPFSKLATLLYLLVFIYIS